MCGQRLAGKTTWFPAAAPSAAKKTAQPATDSAQKAPLRSTEQG